MKKILLFLLLTLQLASCQNHNSNNRNMNEPQYEWGVAVNTPIGYPIRFYAAMVGGTPIVGELYTEKEEPDWGSAYGYESHSMGYLPASVDMVWLSYKEDCFYRLKTAIDYEKIEKLFREGYKERVPNGEVRHKTYDTIVVGIAPGGVVVFWAGNGYKKITEIGRYQAEKIDLKEPPGLDSHERLIFSKEDREEVLNSDLTIPKAVREANKNKPIPFGLWDSYRNHQYQWFPIYEIPDGKIGDVDYRYWNGEAGTTLYTDFNSYMDKKDFFYLEEPIQKRPLFKELVISYKAENGQKYLAKVWFDWEAVVTAYRKVFGKEADKVTAHLDIRVNRNNTYLTFQLIGDNGKQTFLEPKELKFYKLSDKNFITPTPFRLKNMPQKFATKPLLFLLIATFLTSCSMFTPKDDNMKWTAQYNFMDLYKQKVYEGYFNAGAAIEINGIAVINSHTILLGAEKDLRAFDPEILEKQAVLFISTDKGKTYKEIPLEGNYFDSFYKTEDYCIIETSGELHFIYLFNNKTLKVEKIDEYNKKSNIWYGIFDGRYIMYDNKENKYVMDISNRSKMYEIPKAIKNIPTYPINQNGDLIYMKNNDLYIYNVISQQEKLYKKLKNKYDYFSSMVFEEDDTPLTLQQVKNEDNEEKYEKRIYNLDEELLYIINKDNRRKHYRYNNFICDYSALGTSPEIRFSYDYGKTWKTHNVKGFSILQSTFGFYKDEFLVTEGIFFRGNSPESGGRIMVGEFQK